MDIETLISKSPYEMSQSQKEIYLTKQLNNLTQYHYQNCPAYAGIIRSLYRNQTDYPCIEEIPYLPVNIFKEISLSSIPEDQVFKTLTSSGTTGHTPSKIILNAVTSQRQASALAAIMQEYLGIKRLPMLIVDSATALKDPKHFSARGAGIVGMSQFGRDHYYALDDQMQLDKDKLSEWLKKHFGNPIFIFGFTHILWQYLFKNTRPGEFDLSHAILFHGGGWKKLREHSVDNITFKTQLNNHFKLHQCHSFYGMVEQTGSIFVECEKGHLHCPSFADIIIRDPITWNPTEMNQKGVIQTLSLLPTSYPGHSLLTEDLGYIIGVDGCPCGRKGKFFWVEGRIPQAEPRGCSDTFTVHKELIKLPENHEDDLSVVSELSTIPSSLPEHQPFEPVLLKFCQHLSKKLLTLADPDLAALGFWLRPAQISELKKRFKTFNTSIISRKPRGLVFHITASNVDTLFAYSWLLSLLMGNNNIVRLPSKHSDALEEILDIVNNLFKNKNYASIARTNHFIRYAHQKNITEAISLKADVRVIWGSNRTIEEIRKVSLNPYAKEIAFADRSSYAVISSESYSTLKKEQKTHLAQSFFRDAYGFDQHGCSSPRLIVWIGGKENIHRASTEFYQYLNGEIERRKYQVPLSDFMHKQTFVYTLCAEGFVQDVNTFNNELSVLQAPQFMALNTHPGGGLFFHMPLKTLQDLSRFISLDNQTLTYFGIESSTLNAFISELNGRGPIRIVPIGEALNFSSVWDGYDFLQEFTRCVEIH